MFYRLIRTDLKRIAHYGIYMVVAAFVMMTVFLCLALNANSFIYSDDRSEPLSIGIVMSADSKIAQMAYNTISDMDSYHSSCVFTEFSDKDTALSRLSDGDLFAVIYVPDNIISDIMDGTNTPVEVYYSDNRSIDTFVLNDLFRSTSSMLGISQAAIYSVQAIGRNMELPEDIQDTLSNDVNAMFMTKVLDRTANFTVDKINATRAANTTDFYTSAAVLLMMMLCSVVFFPFLLDLPASYITKLRSQGIGKVRRNVSNFISMFIWLYILYITVYMALALASLFIDELHVNIHISGILFGIVIATCVAVYTLLISLLPAGIHGCTLLLTVVTVILAYVSGLFIPEAMLPNFAKDICHGSLLNKLVQTLCIYLS